MLLLHKSCQHHHHHQPSLAGALLATLEGCWQPDSACIQLIHKPHPSLHPCCLLVDVKGFIYNQAPKHGQGKNTTITTVRLLRDHQTWFWMNVFPGLCVGIYTEFGLHKHHFSSTAWTL
jgi:hypothetical protein